jgi:hypothetical protein
MRPDAPPGTVNSWACARSSFVSCSTTWRPSAATTFRVAYGQRPPVNGTDTPRMVPGSTPGATGSETSRTFPRFDPRTSIRAVVPRSTPRGKAESTTGSSPAEIR